MNGQKINGLEQLSIVGSSSRAYQAMRPSQTVSVGNRHPSASTTYTKSQSLNSNPLAQQYASKRSLSNVVSSGGCTPTARAINPQLLLFETDSSIEGNSLNC